MSCTHALGGRMFTNHKLLRVGVCAYCGTPLLGMPVLNDEMEQEALASWQACSVSKALWEALQPADMGDPMRLAALVASRDDLDANPPLIAAPPLRVAYWQAHRILDEQIETLQRRRRNASPLARLRVLAALLSRRH